MSNLSITPAGFKPLFRGKPGELNNLTPKLIGGKKKPTSRAPRASADSRKGRAKLIGKAKGRAKAKAKSKMKAGNGLRSGGSLKTTTCGYASGSREGDLILLNGSRDSNGRSRHLSCPALTACPEKDSKPDACEEPDHAGAINGKLGSVAKKDQPAVGGIEYDPISDSLPGVSGLQSGNPSVEGYGSSSPSGTRKSRVVSPTIRERSLLLRSLDEQP